MKQLENINLTDAKHILCEMRKYADMTKKLGNRGKELFIKTLSGAKNYTVEYFPILGEDAAWEQSQGVFKKSFSVVPDRSDVQFIGNEKIKGGMKVYVDDNMVDLSYKKVENLMQR